MNLDVSKNEIIKGFMQLSSNGAQSNQRITNDEMLDHLQWCNDCYFMIKAHITKRRDDQMFSDNGLMDKILKKINKSKRQVIKGDKG